MTYIGPKAFYSTGYWNNGDNWEDGVLYIGNHLIDVKEDKISSKYKIKDGTKTIANHAFEGCIGLTSITIPEGVTSIGGAFKGCSSLTSITIPEGVTSIDGAFEGCSSLTSITIPEGETYIGQGTFSGCSSLTSITLPESIKTIGEEAFRGCSSLTSITLPESIKTIDENAFRGCSSLTSITIPEGVTSIGGYAFQSCSSLESVTIPEGVTIINRATFRLCSRLTTLKILSKNVYFDPYAFGDNRAPADLSIIGIEGSRVQTYAENINRTFIPLELYTLTFNSNGGSEVDKIKTYEGKIITEPIPAKAEADFQGWYMDAALTDRFIFTKMPAENITLYAKWNINSYTITFHTNGGSDIDPITQEYDSPLTKPNDPSKEGYIFNGWYTDEELTQEYVFPNRMTAGDIDLYAKWEKKYTITFHTNGGNDIDPITQANYSPITQPNDPSREGYIFNGWYTDEKLTQEYVFPDRMPAENIDLYAKWTIITFNITYHANGGEGEPAQAKKEYGITKKISSSIPSKYGYKFMGWAASVGSSEVVYRPGDDYTENKDIELYAVWEYGGKVSDGVEWYFDESDDTIHIVGSGEIPNYAANSNVTNGKPAPWNVLVGQAKNIVIHSGITKVGDFLAGDELIYGDNGLESIKIPDSLKTFSDIWLPASTESRQPLDIICSYGHPVSILAEYDKHNVIYIDDDTTYPAIPSDFPKIPSPNEKLYRVFDSDNTSLLKLSSYTKEATLFYSLDGTDPIQDGEQFVSGSSIMIVPRMTLNTAAVLEGYNTAYGEYTIYKAEAPSNLRIQSTTGTSATLTVNMPEGVSNVIVEYYIFGSGDSLEESYYVTEGTNGTIIVNGLKPLTQYMFKLTCEYNGGGKLSSDPVVGTTGEYLLPDCAVIGVNQPFGSIIDEATKTITAPSVANAFLSVPVDVDVSLGAEWKLYLDEYCTIPIEDNILYLDNEGGYNYGYIKVTAEDGLHVAVYKLKIYRQSKSSPPKFSIPGGSRVPIGTQITLSAEGEIIKYTTDNRDPDENNGIIYTGPITITGETIIKTAAKESDKDEYSEVVAARYTIGDETELITAYYSEDKVTANLTNDVGSGTIIVALYDTDNRCISVQSEKVGVIKKMEFAFEERGSYAKIFWWDNLKSMQPQMTTPIYVKYTE